MIKKIILLFLPLLLGGCWVSQDSPQQPQKTISSFEECVAAGNAVMESYPRQCRTADGRLFVEDVEVPVPPIDEDESICTLQYDPVCALLQVQCIKAPCPPIWTDYSNGCFATVAGATDIQKGTCEDLGLTNQ